MWFRGTGRAAGRDSPRIRDPYCIGPIRTLAAYMATTASPSTSFRLLSECPLPTEDGDVMLRIYGDGTCSPWPVCVFGEVHGKSAVSVRLHDACMTSEVLASVKCDCARQPRLAYGY